MLNTSPDGVCEEFKESTHASIAWHVLWTRSNHEKAVFEQLSSRKYEVFLPMLNQWSQRRRGTPFCEAPMFRSYLFIRTEMDKHSYLEIRKTKGLVTILGSRWDSLATIPDGAITDLKRMEVSGLQAMPWPYLAAGTEVRITRGSLINTRGILVESDVDKATFVISVDMLQRSVAVKVDFSDVEIVYPKSGGKWTKEHI